MGEIDIDNENDDTELEEGEDREVQVFAPGITVSRPGQSKGKDKVHKNDTPVENADEMPLFEGADKRGLRNAQYIRVIKLNNPGSGYKGDIPISSTFHTISQLYGDGIYNLEACNHRHQVLRTKEGLKISMGDSMNGVTPTTGKSSSNEGMLDAIRELNRRHKEEVELIISHATKGAEETKENSRAFVELVKTQTESSMQRDREYMGDITKQQQGFFASMMAMQAQQFQQMMVLQSMGHSHLIQALKTTYEGGNKSSDVDTLIKGIVIAQGLGGDDSPDWLKALDKGGNMIKGLLDLKNATGGEPSNTNPNKETNKEPGKKPNKKLDISKSELLEVIRLKRTLKRRGIDFEEMVRQAREQYVDQEIDAESKEESEESDDSSEQSANNSQEQTE